MKRRTTVRIISFGLAVCAALGGFIAMQWRDNRNLNQLLTNQYTAAMTDLSDCLSQINVLLQKEMYSGTSKGFAELSSHLSQTAGAAKASLARLPVSGEQTDAIFKYLSQVGDFSLSLSRKAAAGSDMTDEERSSLQKLTDYSGKLSDEITAIQTQMETTGWDGEITAIFDEASDELSDLNSAIEDTAQTVTGYPTLIYDGPFSDHVNSLEPEYIKDKTAISRDEAAKIAAKYLECDTDEAKFYDDEDGQITAYVFTHGDDSVAITRQGGVCLYLYRAHQPETVEITEEEAVAKALSYAQDRFGMSFQESYYMVNENICVVNLAYLLEDTICYSDLVKVGVAMDTGEIVSVEAQGLIMNHKERSAPQPEKTQEEARASVSSALDIRSVNTAIIQREDLKEVLCYEFVCKGQNDENILVYVNADTLDEENILMLIETEGGVMTR